MTTLPMEARPLGIGDLLDRAFRLYRGAFGPLLLIAAVFLVPMGILNGLILGEAAVSPMAGYLALLQGEAPVEQAPVEVASELGRFMLAGLISVIFGALATLALIAACASALRGEEPVAGAAARLAIRRMPAYLGLLILQSLAIGAASLPFACAIVAAGVGLGTLASIGSESSTWGAIGLGLLMIPVFLLLIAGLSLVMARWLSATPGLVDAGWGPLHALRASWALSRGQSMRSLGFLVALTILGSVFTTVLGAVLQVPLAFAPAETITGVLSQVGTALVQVIWQPIYAAALLLFYHDLRLRSGERPGPPADPESEPAPAQESAPVPAPEPEPAPAPEPQSVVEPEPAPEPAPESLDDPERW